jgi:hypothetical protein
VKVNEQVHLIGDRESQPADVTTIRVRPSTRVLHPMVLAVSAVAAYMLVPDDRAATEVDGANLESPDSPAVASPLDRDEFADTPVDQASPLMVGWSAVPGVASPSSSASVSSNPDGFLVTAGSSPPVLFSSEDGSSWRVHTLHGLRIEDAVADRLGDVVAVFGGWRPSDDRPIGAVSTDAGSTWTAISVEGSASIRSVEVLDGRIVVGGSVGTPGQDLRFSTVGRAEMWEVDGSVLRSLDLERGVPSQIVDVVSGPDGAVLGLGSNVGRASVWADDGSDPSTIDVVGAGTFLDVERDRQGFVALGAGVTGRELWRSVDGVNCRRLSLSRTASRVSLAVRAPTSELINAISRLSSNSASISFLPCTNSSI